jgi:hypothetical protein
LTKRKGSQSGPTVVVETKDVSGAMNAFGQCLDGSEKCSGGEIQDRSFKLASTLEIRC